MILAEPDYNPGILQQAMGRVIRKCIFKKQNNIDKTKCVGNRGHVKIISLLSVSPDPNMMTLDEQMYEIMLYKLEFIRMANNVYDKLCFENIGLNSNVKYSTASTIKFNLKKSMKHNLKLEELSLNEYKRTIKQSVQDKLNKIRTLTVNAEILRKANIEVGKQFKC